MNGNLKHSGLILVSGVDKPGITEKLFKALSPFNLEVLDFEQVVIRDRLLLTVLIALDSAHEVAIEEDLLKAFEGSEFDIAMDFGARQNQSPAESTLHVVALGKTVKPAAIAQIAEVIGKYRGNIDRVRRTAFHPITAIEFEVSANLAKSELQSIQSELAKVSFDSSVDIAVTLGGPSRRAKRVVLLDMDSTLIQQEVIDLLAKKAGSGERVAAITERAMRGELDFTESLMERVGTLAGLSEQAISEVASEIKLTAGAETLISVLHKLGHKVGVVSGGFINVIEPLLKQLRVDFYKANTLEVVDGKLTGKVLGPVIDREAKAKALREFAALEQVSIEQTIAIGDGANDLGMIEIAGLGIAFNAKPKVRAVADTSINTPYLDSVLYLIGISREEIETISK
jgi:phosphoserine phosphatase